MRLCTIWFNKSYLNLRYTVKVFAAIFVSKALSKSIQALSVRRGEIWCSFCALVNLS